MREPRPLCRRPPACPGGPDSKAGGGRPKPLDAGDGDEGHVLERSDAVPQDLRQLIGAALPLASRADYRKERAGQAVPGERRRQVEAAVRAILADAGHLDLAA